MLSDGTVHVYALNPNAEIMKSLPSKSVDIVQALWPMVSGVQMAKCANDDFAK